MNAHPPKQHSGSSPNHRKQETLGQHLAKGAPAARTQSRTNRDLAAAIGSTREKEVCDVDASNQKHKAYSAKNRQQSGARMRRELFLKLRCPHAPALVVIRGRDVSENSFRFSGELLRCSTRLQPHDYMVAAVTIRKLFRREVPGNPKVESLVEDKIVRHDADDAVWSALEHYLSTDDAVVAGIAPLPCPMRQNDYARRAGSEV